MADAKTLGLTELARLGFAELEGTLQRLEQLVKIVGDPGRAAFAPLSHSANPDQALKALIELGERDSASLKKALKQHEIAALPLSVHLAQVAIRQSEDRPLSQNKIAVLPLTAHQALRVALLPEAPQLLQNKMAEQLTPAVALMVLQPLPQCQVQVDQHHRLITFLMVRLL